ncbi:hypothetical protein ACFLUE_01045 [Chloroflexota bacterium]
MKKIMVLTGLMLALIAGLATTGFVSATPSGDFHKVNGEIFDDWEICRTRAGGEDGFYQISRSSFRPVIAFESLGEETARAYRMGEQIAAEYPDWLRRAEAIFSFVQGRVNYTSDTDQFNNDEFAQNADELISAIERDGVGYGDCEDSAVLLAVMYQGAGYRSAIAVGPGHTAALLYLPEYKKASAVLELEGESGWIWAEATGKNNPLGWMPKEYVNAELGAYEIGDELITSSAPAGVPAVAVTTTGGGSSSRPFSFIGVIGFLWLMSLFRRRGRAHRRR